MTRLGRGARSHGVIYITVDATALCLTIRDQTIDIDIKLDPEPPGVFEAIADLKNTLRINVELAAPDQFIPPLPGWKDRSPLITTVGKVEFRHFDYYPRALAKIERGHEKDLQDTRALISLGLVDPQELTRLASAITRELIRYPAVSPADFGEKLHRFIRELPDGD